MVNVSGPVSGSNCSVVQYSYMLYTAENGFVDGCIPYHAIKWKQLMFYVIYVIEDGYRLPAQLLVVETSSGCLDSITASCRSVRSTDVSCAPWKLSGLSSAIGTWHTKAIKGLTALTHDIHHVDKDPITLTCRKLKEVEQMLVTDLQEANRRDWNSSRDSSWTLMILMKSDERGRTRQKLDLQDFATRYIMWIHDDTCGPQSPDRKSVIPTEWARTKQATSRIWQKHPKSGAS